VKVNRKLLEYCGMERVMSQFLDAWGVEEFSFTFPVSRFFNNLCFTPGRLIGGNKRVVEVLLNGVPRVFG